MIKKKRGVLVLKSVFGLIFIVIILTFLLLGIRNIASGDAIKKQILAKEICMVTLSSATETRILIEHDKNIIVEKDDSKIVVKKGRDDKGYSYDCYFKENVKISRKDDITVIEIN